MLSTLFGNACAHLPYTYVVSEATAENVSVEFVGISEIKLNDAAPPTRTLHLRMKLENDSRADWRLDVREVEVTFPAHGKNRAAYIVSPQAGVPQVSIKPGETRALQFYFPLPSAVTSASELPAFTVSWRLHTPEKEIARQTEFERRRVITSAPATWSDPLYPYGYDGGPGWGVGTYWYDPFWLPWPGNPPPAFVPGPPGHAPIPLVPRAH